MLKIKNSLDYMFLNAYYSTFDRKYVKMMYKASNNDTKNIVS